MSRRRSHSRGRPFLTTAPSLFEPTELAGVALRNRIVMAPMTRAFAPGGVPNADNAEYYRRRAAGGVGLIITEGIFIDHPSAGDQRDIPRMSREGLAGWDAVVKTVHDAGAAIFAQLWHMGMQRSAAVARDTGVASIGPSPCPELPGTLAQSMTVADIREVVEAYARAAVDARELGFDGVEIHGAHGYLIDQFLWRHTNRRSDAYGGDLANRARFACEVIRAVKDAAGAQFPVSFRVSQWKQQDYTARLADTAAQWADLVTALVAAGVDALHVSTRRYSDPAFPDDPTTLAALTRRTSGVPVITVGSVGLTDIKQRVGWETDPTLSVATAGNLTDLELRLRQGEFDLVAVGRVLLANPGWASHVHDGHFDALRPYTLAARDTLL